MHRVRGPAGDQSEPHESLPKLQKRGLEKRFGEDVRDVVDTGHRLKAKKVAILSLVDIVLPKVDVFRAITAAHRAAGPLDAGSIIFKDSGGFSLRKIKAFKQTTGISQFLNH